MRGGGKRLWLLSVEATAALPAATGARNAARGAGRGRGPVLARRRSLLPAPVRQSAARHRHECFEPRSRRRLRLRRTQRSMLQQMSSSLSAQLGEVTAIARPIEGRLGADVFSEASSDAPEDFELPHCKIRRNYNCPKCTFYTQNPRAYLLHTRDVHFGRFKIYECQHCLYASRHHQKLLRHMKMVHGTSPALSAGAPRADAEPAATPSRAEAEPLSPVDDAERMEDLLEEIEECDDILDEDEELAERMDDTDARGSNANLPKGKGKFFSCDKCNYVTHIKARYTKHVKYHSMPMIKCTMCDFRTPYKWNLDRHMKNHGGSGSFVCSKCTFTADIKQSLTVHEMNHHTPPVGHVTNRRRNRVGASDLTAAEPADALLPKEEEGSGDSHSSHSASDAMGLQYAERDIVSCNSDSNDASSSHADTNKDGSHEGQHSPHSDDKSHKQSRKAPRPIPQLIPLNASTPNQKTSGEPPAKKFKESVNLDGFGNLPDDITLIPVTPAKEAPARKKNNSFFDKLKERLLTETGEEGSLKCKNCGFESKCLSEHSVHEKNCTVQSNRVLMNAAMPTMGSTRCQHCRHRCKSSADLYVHMQTCGKNKTSAERSSDTKYRASTSQTEKESEPHPMENVVFVWNNINQDSSKFERPLDININDDSTITEMNRHYEMEAVDENESMNLSPNSLSLGKNVYKCPDCKFWAATASRFHVHIVGHLNKKPFECSLCRYKSNWRWDITKHIKLKSARDPEHNEAKVLMTDETGRRNYSKYNKFLAVPVLNENGENEFHYIDPNTSVDASMEMDETYGNETGDMLHVSYDMPLNLQTQHPAYNLMDNRLQDPKKPKKTLWKCKKCNYKDPSKEALLEHVRQHSKEGAEEGHSNNKKLENAPDPADLAYRCGHCNQLSNWKHVIQRHCRLKHDGIIKVITTVKPKPELSNIEGAEGAYNDLCTKCPFKANDKKQLLEHLAQHQPSPESIFKCYFCPYFVKDEQDLIQHLLLHGITDPEDYIAKAMGCRSPLPDRILTNAEIPPPVNTTKRHKCTECPYETNSKSQYMYHEQFHRLPADTPYKCPECNYSVSKRHLLHQHLRVHGIHPSDRKKNESEAELEASSSKAEKQETVEQIPFVWVSARNEFHKMYKCRYCSYVNSQKGKLPNHEKIHCLEFENSDVIIYKCLECKFTCDDAEKAAEHSKKHGLLYGRIYSYVEDDLPDEEQIAKLRRLIDQEKALEESNKEDAPADQTDTKIMFYCRKCPAFFFSEGEIKVHEKFHDSTLENKCKLCEFSVPDEKELATHMSVHLDDYHIKTNMFKFVHNYHSQYKPPRLECLRKPDSSEVTWVAILNKPVEYAEQVHRKSDSRHTPKQYHCKECPAKFFKSSALSYHMGLHGGEGEHKCKKCSYAVKNVGNLAKHEVLHDNEHKTAGCEYDSGEDADYKNVPLSGTDLFQRKTEALKRVMIDKDKLVKPNDHFPPVLQADPQFGYLMHGNPEFIYPTYLKNGRQKEKRYKCHKCPSAFEKREQYKIHLSLHGSKQRYKCELCDYSVKYYANYVQHMRKHQMNDEAQAERKKGSNGSAEFDNPDDAKQDDSVDNIKLAIKTMPKGTPKTDFQQFSIRDQQTLRLLQRKRLMMNGGKEAGPADASPAKERKLHMCLLCPYTNQRQDALNNHYRRHDAADILNIGNHKCSHCDLVVVQSHFLREHLKTHFSYHKTLTPECYAANEDVTFTISKVEDDSEPVDLKLNMESKIVFDEEKIFVNMKSGEIVVE